MTGTFDLRATSGAITSTIGRFVAQTSPPPTGDYSAARFWPANNRDAWLLANGLTRNLSTGFYDGDLYSPEPTWDGSTVLTDQGSRAANEAAVVAAIAANASNTSNHAILLGAVATSWGAITIATRAANVGWLGLIRIGVDQVRAPGVRIQAADASQLAPFRARAINEPAIDIRTGARRVYLSGLSFALDPAFDPGAVMDFNQRTARGLLDFSHFNQPGTDWAREVVVDRCHFIGEPTETRQLQRFIHGEAVGDVCIRHNYMRAPGWGGNESQGIYIQMGGGRVQIENNSVEFANGINLFIGGGGIQLSEAQRLRGVLIRRNRVAFPPEWIGVYGTKNAIETKGADDTLAERNLITGFRGEKQGGQRYAIVAKGSQAPSNVYIVRCNELRECSGFFGPAADSGGVTNIDIHQNLFRRPTGARIPNLFGSPEVLAFGTQTSGVFGQRVRNYRIAYNHIAGSYLLDPSFARIANVPSGPPAGGEQGLRFTDNVLLRDDGDDAFTYIGRDGGGTAANAWADLIVGGTDNQWARNLVSRTTANLVPGDVGVATEAALGLNPDLSLSPSSPGVALAEDGGPVGASIPLVTAAISGVTTGL